MLSCKPHVMSCQTFQACASWWSWACKVPTPLGTTHMIYTHTLTSHVAVANVGRHSILCVERSWPQRTPVMCDNSSRHVWHISGRRWTAKSANSGPKMIGWCSWVSTWLQVGGQVELLICCLVWRRGGHICLPKLPPHKGLNRWHFLRGTWKSFSATYFWPFTGFNGMELSIPWAPTSLQVLEFVRVQQKRNESICTREWTLERLQTAVYVNLSEN